MGNGKGDKDRVIDRKAYSNHYKSMMDKKCDGCEFYMKEQCRCLNKEDGCLRQKEQNEDSERKNSDKAQ